MHDSPALDLHFPTLAGPSDLGDRILLLLDDFQPLAVDEGTSASGAVHAPPTRWRVHFSTSADRDRAATGVAPALARLGVTITPIDVPDEGWVERSQAGLRAIQIDRITVAPPWDVPEGSGALLIVIRPSMGFGTGHHASTRLCLRALQRLDLAGRDVLDIGTGSGVLALAAARLGASRVVGIDCDPDALGNARENAALNDLTGLLTLRQADLADAERIGLEPADVVMANLTAGVLGQEAGRLRRLTRVGGMLIVSGVLVDQATPVAAALESGGAMAVVWREEEEGWVGLTLTSRQS